MSLKDEFIHDHNSPHHYRYKVGKHIATALSGFIAGAAVASIVWVLGIIIFKAYLGMNWY